jgi:hypothetical protein
MTMCTHSRSGYALMAHSCGHVYKPSGSILDAKFRDQLVPFSSSRMHLLRRLVGELLVVN